MGLDKFEEDGYKIKRNSIKSLDIKIEEEEIKILIEYPISAEKAETVHVFENFETSIPINFNEKYGLLEKIVNEQSLDIESIPLGYLTNLAHENDFFFEAINLDDDTILFSFIFDEERNSKEVPFMWNFVNNYNWEIGDEN